MKRVGLALVLSLAFAFYFFNVTDASEIDVPTDDGPTWSGGCGIFCRSGASNRTLENF